MPELITHWIAYERPGSDHIIVRTESGVEDYEEEGWTVEGPFVHMDEVERLREALWHARTYLEIIDTVKGRTAIAGIIRDALEDDKN